MSVCVLLRHTIIKKTYLNILALAKDMTNQRDKKFTSKSKLLKITLSGLKLRGNVFCIKSSKREICTQDLCFRKKNILYVQSICSVGILVPDLRHINLYTGI